MTKITAQRSTFGQMNRAVPVIVAQVIPVRCSLRKHGSFQVKPMAGLAGSGIIVVEIFMAQVPGDAVDVVHPVRAIEGGWQTGVTATAFANGTGGMTLQLHSRPVVIG